MEEAGEGIEVRYQDGTIWLKQKLMAQLFDVDVRTISEHLGNIFCFRGIAGKFSYPEIPDNCQ